MASSNHGHSHRKRERSRTISVRVRPTVGLPFEVSLSSSARVSSLKESISDKMGLSTHKMTLLLNSDELRSGTLYQNSVSDGTEVLLVPALETGVATTNSMDPVAMMKHSMSGITDQQVLIRTLHVHLETVKFVAFEAQAILVTHHSCGPHCVPFLPPTPLRSMTS
jgi:hypothetical protein